MLSKEERVTLLMLVEEEIKKTSDIEYLTRLENIFFELEHEFGIPWLGSVDELFLNTTTNPEKIAKAIGHESE